MKFLKDENYWGHIRKEVVWNDSYQKDKGILACTNSIIISLFLSSFEILIEVLVIWGIHKISFTCKIESHDILKHAIQYVIYVILDHYQQVTIDYLSNLFQDSSFVDYCWDDEFLYYPDTIPDQLLLF